MSDIEESVKKEKRGASAAVEVQEEAKKQEAAEGCSLHVSNLTR
jgi:hypothetical protein